ncbi:universal stress protein [Streptomyces sp. NPDC015242]|uniref:universal stress protein n=1 Tax=Streptomyces sp. NPDC015242 TaxID=3364951 RepID=UPI0036FD7103
MPRTVTAGVDGSPESLAAAEWAAREALLRDLPLRLVYAWEWQPPAYVPTAGLPVPVPPTEQQRVAARRLLDETRERLARRHPGLGIDADEIPGQPAAALLKAAEEAELLVLGSRGLSRLAGYLVGSVALSVLAWSARPVVLVRAGEHREGALAADASAADASVTDRPAADAPVAGAPVADDHGSDGPMADASAADRPAADAPVADDHGSDGPMADASAAGSSGSGDVVLGLDLYKAADPVIEFAFDAASRRAADLRVVHGWTLPPYHYGGALMPELSARTAAQVRHELTAVLRPWQEKFPAVRVQAQATVGGAGAHLVDASRGAALVVVGRRIRRGAVGAHIGPVTQALLHHAAAPVAVISHD